MTYAALPVPADIDLSQPISVVFESSRYEFQPVDPPSD